MYQVFFANEPFICYLTQKLSYIIPPKGCLTAYQWTHITLHSNKEKNTGLVFLFLSIFYPTFFTSQLWTMQVKQAAGWEEGGDLLSCRSPLSPPFSSVELCWMETGLISEVFFNSGGNLPALWHITPQPESWASITISLICLLFFWSLFPSVSLCPPSSPLYCFSLCFFPSVFLLSIKTGYFTFWVEPCSPESDFTVYIGGFRPV